MATYTKEYIEGLIESLTKEVARAEEGTKIKDYLEGCLYWWQQQLEVIKGQPEEEESPTNVTH